jgi:hypothetical protein
VSALERWRRAFGLRRAHQPEFESRLVWIFGSPRSGSTWLLNLLALHESVVAINEPLIGWYLGPFLSDLPNGDASALDVTNFTLRRVQRANAQSFFAEEFRDVWSPGLARLMRERFYEHVVRSTGARPRDDVVVAIKEPSGSQSADLIMRALPRSRLLFLLRDGRDVVDSELAGNLEGGWVGREFPGLRPVGEAERLPFVVQSAHKWLWRTEVVEQAFREHAGPKRLVRYEQLLADTHGELTDLLAWLGLPARDQELRAWIDEHAFGRQQVSSTGPRGFFRAASPGTWRQSLRPDEQAALERVMGRKLRELGYES